MFHFLRSLFKKKNKNAHIAKVDDNAILREHRERAHQIILKNRQRNEEAVRINRQSIETSYSSDQNDDSDTCNSSSDSSCE